MTLINSLFLYMFQKGLKIKGYPIIFFLLISTGAFSQESEDAQELKYLIIEGDTIPDQFINLEEVILFDRLKFDTYEEKKRYYILKRKTHKVYPYAKLAAERLQTLTKRLQEIDSKRGKKKYTKRIQKYIEGEFSAELRKLTRTEGQILIKLIHRQTGANSFNLVKELRNGWRAFWYNTTASMFDISMKEEFDPINVQEDYLIEDILQRAFAKDHLESQPSALDYNYAELTNKWAGDQEDK